MFARVMVAMVMVVIVVGDVVVLVGVSIKFAEPVVMSAVVDIGCLLGLFFC